MAMSLTFRSAVVGAMPSAKLLQAKSTTRVSATVKPATTVALFGKKQPAKPAGAPKAKVKGLYGPTGRNGAAKPKPKPFAPKPKPAAKKPIAKKPIAKKAAAKPAAKPLFSFGSSSKPAAKKPVAKKSAFSFGSSTTSKTTVKKTTTTKSKYNIKKTTGTTIKKKPIVRSKPIATVKVAAPKPKPVAVKKAAAAAEPAAPKKAVYDKEQVGTFGVASIFAGTFLLTLAVLPTAVETALEVVGIGYTTYFTYTYITSQESRDEFGKKLDEIEESTGLDLKQVAQVTGELADKTSKQLAEQAEKAAEKSAAKKAEAKKEAEKMADKAVAEVEAKVEEAMEEK